MTSRDDQTPVSPADEQALVPVDNEALVPVDDAPGEAAEAGEWLVAPGTEVVDAQGTLVGKVDDIRDGHLVVRKGRFFVADYYIPFAAIGSHDDTTIYLAVVADEQAARIWHQRPSERGQGEGADPRYGEADAETRMEHMTDRDGNVRIPVLQEELVASRRPVVRGKVRIETQISEHEQTLEVPVTEERVRIQRRVIDRDATGAEIVVDGGTFEVPFYGEDIDVEKRIRVIEEIIITREAVETVRRVRGTVRREDVEVDDSNVPLAVEAPQTAELPELLEGGRPEDV
jgi:uncharacterized protein (TIGR02271 family)